MNDEIDLVQLRLASDWINLTNAFRDGRPPPNLPFWESLMAATLATRRSLPRDQKIFRARRMSLERELDAAPLPMHEMGPPTHGNARAGRLNPQGVCLFYGAFERETAIAEVRPWRRARITVAQFTVTTDLTVADLTLDPSLEAHVEPIHWLSYMIGRPVHPDDSESYLASQRIAEECRKQGLDGLLYDSALQRGGVNVALFDVAGIDYISAELYEITRIEYSSALLSVMDDAQHKANIRAAGPPRRPRPS